MIRLAEDIVEIAKNSTDPKISEKIAALQELNVDKVDDLVFNEHDEDYEDT